MLPQVSKTHPKTSCMVHKLDFLYNDHLNISSCNLEFLFDLHYELDLKGQHPSRLLLFCTHLIPHEKENHEQSSFLHHFFSLLLHFLLMYCRDREEKPLSSLQQAANKETLEQISKKLEFHLLPQIQWLLMSRLPYQLVHKLLSIKFHVHNNELL